MIFYSRFPLWFLFLIKLVWRTPELPCQALKSPHYGCGLDGKWLFFLTQINIPLVYGAAVFILQGSAVVDWDNPGCGIFTSLFLGAFRAGATFFCHRSPSSWSIWKPDEPHIPLPRDEIFSQSWPLNLLPNGSGASVCLKILLRTVEGPCFLSVQGRFIFLQS